MQYVSQKQQPHVMPARIFPAKGKSERDDLETVTELVHVSEIAGSLKHSLPNQESAHLRLESLHPFRLTLAPVEALLVRPLRQACLARRRPTQ